MLFAVASCQSELHPQVSLLKARLATLERSINSHNIDLKEKQHELAADARSKRISANIVDKLMRSSNMIGLAQIKVKDVSGPNGNISPSMVEDAAVVDWKSSLDALEDQIALATQEQQALDDRIKQLDQEDTSILKEEDDVKKKSDDADKMYNDEIKKQTDALARSISNSKYDPHADPAVKDALAALEQLMNDNDRSALDIETLQKAGEQQYETDVEQLKQEKRKERDVYRKKLEENKNKMKQLKEKKNKILFRDNTPNNKNELKDVKDMIFNVLNDDVTVLLQITEIDIFLEDEASLVQDRLELAACYKQIEDELQPVDEFALMQQRIPLIKTNAGFVKTPTTLPANKLPLTPAGPTPVTPAGKAPLTPNGPAPLTPVGATPVTPTGAQPITPPGAMPKTPVGIQPTTPPGTQPATPAGVMPQVQAPLNNIVPSAPQKMNPLISTPTPLTPNAQPPVQPGQPVPMTPQPVVPGQPVPPAQPVNAATPVQPGQPVAPAAPTTTPKQPTYFFYYPQATPTPQTPATTAAPAKPTPAPATPTPAGVKPAPQATPTTPPPTNSMPNRRANGTVKPVYYKPTVAPSPQQPNPAAPQTPQPVMPNQPTKLTGPTPMPTAAPVNQPLTTPTQPGKPVAPVKPEPKIMPAVQPVQPVQPTGTPTTKPVTQPTGKPIPTPRQPTIRPAPQPTANPLNKPLLISANPVNPATPVTPANPATAPKKPRRAYATPSNPNLLIVRKRKPRKQHRPLKNPGGRPRGFTLPHFVPAPPRPLPAKKPHSKIPVMPNVNRPPNRRVKGHLDRAPFAPLKPSLGQTGIPEDPNSNLIKAILVHDMQPQRPGNQQPTIATVLDLMPVVDKWINNKKRELSPRDFHKWTQQLIGVLSKMQPEEYKKVQECKSFLDSLDAQAQTSRKLPPKPAFAQQQMGSKRGTIGSK